MTIPEKFIREAARKGQIKYSNHAQLRMGERKIPRLLEKSRVCLLIMQF